MRKLMIPPNPNWFMQSLCFCTPDNGLIYGAITKIVFIPPTSKDTAESEIKIIDLNNKLSAFSLNPNWNDDSKRIAVINADFNVLVYDFKTCGVIKGHRGHENVGGNTIPNQQHHMAITFLKQNAVLSSVDSNVIHFCLLTNTFKIFLDFSSRNPISMLKPSPKNANLVAAGTKNGLILLIAVDTMQIAAKLRGHDTEVTSLDWMYFSMTQAKEVPQKKGAANSLENLIASTDTSDCFDIYVENVEPEFGVYGAAVEAKSDDEEVIDGELQEKIANNANFNFLEACNDLKGDILADEEATGDSAKGTYEDNKERYGVQNEKHPSLNGSLDSNASSRTPVLTEESLNYLDECQRMKDFVIVSKEDVAQIDDFPVLASGSREQVAWLWDVNERTAFCKINWRVKTRPALPTPFTSVLWIDQDTLLVTDGNGDINEYKICFDPHVMKLTFKETKGKKFSAKGVLNMCKSDDSSVVWISSIHRHISCLDVKKDYEKIVSLDTIQLRIHCIVENPIDSNVIAVGGNDKRICLWNTSVVNSSTVSLRPFMNKIHSGVLSLSWHPDKDNIIAFSTREGRIGVLDVNKSSNVPTILPSFSSQEVYSIAWAKTQVNGSDSVILIACNGHKLVTFSQKDQWKLRHIDHLKHSSSVAVSGNILAIGIGNGELVLADISRDFYVLIKKKICRKYVGMMSWHGETLAIATESGITLIEGVNSNISEIDDDKLLKLEGHKGRVLFVRFNKAGSLLVSCCVNGYVKVWDLETMKLLSNFNIETPAYSAIFLPNNEDIIVCGGQDSTVLSFEWRKYPAEPDAVDVVLKKKQHIKNVQWAAPTEVTTISKNTQRRQKNKITKAPATEDSITELTSDIVKLNLQTKKGSTIFHSAYRELLSNPLELLDKILSNDERELCFNEKIFGSRDKVKEVIENELQQNQSINSKTHGGVVLPQLNDALKADILKRIENKMLTEVHVAVAPSVSHDIWRKCCIAYGNQCIENEDSLAAIPYFLAVNDVDNCVSQLCEGKYFREAWIIAKMRKDESDPIFEGIMNKWTAYFDHSGNYEAGATLLACNKDFKKAKDLLEKRQNKSEKCVNIIEMLSTKTV